MRPEPVRWWEGALFAVLITEVALFLWVYWQRRGW